MGLNLARNGARFCSLSSRATVNGQTMPMAFRCSSSRTPPSMIRLASASTRRIAVSASPCGFNRGGAASAQNSPNCPLVSTLTCRRLIRLTGLTPPLPLLKPTRRNPTAQIDSHTRPLRASFTTAPL